MKWVALLRLRRLCARSWLLGLGGTVNGHNRQCNAEDSEEPGANEHTYHSTGRRHAIMGSLGWGAAVCRSHKETSRYTRNDVPFISGSAT